MISLDISVKFAEPMILCERWQKGYEFRIARAFCARFLR
jgi:hypothetical protein